MKDAALELKHVHFSVNGLHILKDITGIIPKGKITTLVGPSGAGKSTLFKLCNGLQTTSSGDIYIKNKRIGSYEPTELRRLVGIALQEATMLSGSVMKNIAMPLTLQGMQMEKEEAAHLLEIVGLDQEFLNRDASDLSGGQRQRLSIARTLVNRPQILLLDEITSSLDKVSQQDIEKLIVKINQEFGTTIMWITHNLEQAISIGDYTWVMMDGELVETGPSDLLNNPSDARVKRFVKGEIE